MSVSFAFILGLFIGACVGIFILSILVVSGRADSQISDSSKIDLLEEVINETS